MTAVSSTTTPAALTLARPEAAATSSTEAAAARAYWRASLALALLDVADAIRPHPAVVDFLRQMGARIDMGPDGVRVRGGQLTGCELDLNATPDALPMLAVVGCFARGQTRLVNVPQARLKETDRIAAMRAELSKMGAKITERPDGLVIEESNLRSATVEGHYDHRVVMALAVAATAISGQTRITTAEAVAVTFPTFLAGMSALGGKLRMASDEAQLS